MKSKKIFFAMAVTVFTLSTSPALAENPLVSQKYTADPTAIVWNDRVYVYCSNDDDNPTSGGYDIKAYTLVSSDDMANWTDHGEVFRVPRDLSAYNQAYAPGAAVKGGKVYLYIPNGGNGIGVASADRPEGPFNDGKALISKNAQQNTNVPWLFDPAGFVDTDGQGYIYFGGGDDGGENLRGAKLNADMMSWQTPATTIGDTKCSFEAAYVHKRGDYYYFSYSTNFSCNDNSVGNGNIAYLMSTNPLTGYQYKGRLFGGVSGNNHTSVIEFKDKWYLFYHDRRLKESASTRPSWITVTNDSERRSVGVDILEYNSDNTIKQVTRTAAGPAQIKNLNPFDTVRAVTINTMSGIRTAASAGGNGNEGGTGKEGRQILTDIGNNDWIRIKGVDFGSGAVKVKVRAAAAGGAGGSVEFRTGSNTGTLIGTCNITPTGGWTTWDTFECDVDVSGVKDFLYLVFKGSASELFRLDSYIFEGEGTVQCGTPPDATPGNLVKDGLFPGSILGENWTLSNVDGGAEASASVKCNKAAVNITSVGEEAYQPQITQQGITLEQGKAYRLTFKASAAGNRTITVQFERLGDPDNGVEWGYKYGEKSFSLTTAETAYTLEFDMTDPTDESVQLAFNFGGSTQDVTLSEVALVSTGSASVGGKKAVSLRAAPLISIKGRTLNVNVSADVGSKVRVRLVNMAGKTIANFNTSGNAKLSLKKIPAGAYIVEARRVKDGYKTTSAVMLR